MTHRYERHGLAYHPLHALWREMHNRCSNPNNNAYRNYGGRGIWVCQRWDSFANFLEDMGERPTPKHQLDRKDVNLDYTPENCRWITQKENLNNKRTNRRVEWKGENLTVTQWAERLNIHPRTLHYRVCEAGWSIERAFGLESMKGGQA